MASRACVQRLQKEFRALCKEPVAHVLARPSPTNILDWHYVLEGTESSPFAGGIYHGKLKFPKEYPFHPPAISMITPNGRFATDRRLCMSMSDFHPETWNPMWSVSSILTGLLSFMMDNAPTTGSVSTTVEEKRKLAQASLAYNCKSSIFREMFPEYVEKHIAHQKALERMVEEQEQQQQREVQSVRNKASTANVPLLVAGRSVVQGARLQKQGEKFPFWLTALLFALFASVMALPLLTLDFSRA